MHADIAIDFTATKVKERNAPALAAAAVTLVDGHDGKSIAKL